MFEKNKTYKLRGRILISNINFFVYIFTFLFFTFIINGFQSNFNVLGYATNVNINDIHSKVNSYRKDKGVPTLKLNQQLNRAATLKAQDMIKNNYWAHVSPKGRTPWSFISSSGYEFTVASENLAMDFDTSAQIVKAWQKSAAHNANLVSSDFTEVGYAVINGKLEGNDTTLVVQMFGHPKYIPAVIKDKPIEKNIDVKVENVLGDTEVEQTVNEEINQPLDISTLDTSAQLIDQEILNINDKEDIISNNNISLLKFMPSTKNFAIGFAMFIIVLYLIDIVMYIDLYKVKHTGNTLAHIFFLIFAIFIIWQTTSGIIL